MTDLISFVPPPTTTATSGTNSAATLADNFDTFLTILTAQIQNQDPLEPLDSSQFTEQLVQFSGVEQQIKANQQLESLLTASRASTGAALAGYLGQDAEINASGAQFAGEPIRFRYALPQDADTATITITDKDGKVVFSKTGETEAGSHDYTWDGKLANGEMAAGDVYYINVIAKTADNVTITPVHSVLATITGVDLTFGEPALTTPSGIYAYSDIKRLLHKPATTN